MNFPHYRYLAGFFLALLFAGAPAAQSREQGILLSVDEFEAIGVDRSVAAGVTEIMRAELAGSRRLRLLEETGRLYRLQRSSARFRDLMAEKNLLRLGELLESRRVLTGSVSRLDSLLVLTARVVDAETGVALAGEAVEHAAGPGSLGGAVRSLARKVLAHFPLTGQVVGVRGDTLTADLGLADGLLPGQELTVLDLAARQGSRPEWSAEPVRSARVKVADLDDRTCRLVPLIPQAAKGLGTGSTVVSAVGRGLDDISSGSRGKPGSSALDKAEKDFGAVLVESAPAGALTALAGLDVGRTPVRVAHLAPGSHPLVLHLPGYELVADSVEAVPGTLQKYSFKLERRTGRLTIVTGQPDVVLLIDTLELTVAGTGTVTLEDFPAGVHSLRASKRGYRTLQDRLVIDSAQDTTVEVRLEPHPGSLLVSSNPSAAGVYIDGVYTGKLTPWRLTRLAAGGHVVRVSLPGFGSAVDTAVITPGEDLTLQLELRPGWFDYVPAGMVLVSAGRDSLSLRDFYLDTYEVTNRRYAYFVSATGHKPPRHWKDGVPPPGGEDLPVVNVSYEDAVRFAAWEGKRLPTEQEWERAAFGDAPGKYPWGDSYRPGGASTWGEGLGGPAPGGSFFEDASPFGVFDMVGNVSEWVDAWIGGAPGRQGLYRVYRGGSYYINDTDPSLFSRDGHYPISSNQYIGFRCARDKEVKR
ncbi:MAG: SUMF1/EgtB/PvdO family nonheme iron enzyme [Candidatus Glassbacteria bacterium]|nr:SUMF1/EgtB/PvdO family nonheme iron enzyme [Candidatus Glassbacteria bacterium]